MLSSEGVTQGDPLSMVLYGLALVPLAKHLRSEVPEITSPFYADDSAFSGPVSKIYKAMKVLEKHGPSRGYYPEPNKSILICPATHRQRAQDVLQEFHFKFLEGTCYVGGFIGSVDSLSL